MRINNLELPLFAQAQVLKLVPGLTSKTLQNWAARGLVDLHDPSPGRQAKRLYSAIGVIMLDAMVQMTSLGIGPSDARTMANQIADCAEDLWSREPDEEGDHGERKIVIDTSRLAIYRRGYVRKVGSHHEMDVRSEPLISNLRFDRIGFPAVYLVVEVDLLTIDALNRMHRLLAGLPVMGTDDKGSKSKRGRK